jgi:ABC-2 type transport system permease protein
VTTSSTRASDADALVPDQERPSPALEVSRRPSPLRRLANLWTYRELIGNLTRKELKVKYKNSVLGFLWSLLNPLMYLIVFSLVFSLISKVGVPYFGIFFLSGLLAWNFFSAALTGGTISIVSNAGLVTKVWFPREALVIASILAAVVHFLLQSLVLLAAMAVFRRVPDFTWFPVLLLAIVTLMVFCAALAIALSAVNVYLRDTQHLLEVALMAWFWMSAIAMNYGQIAERLVEKWGPRSELYASFNPMLTIVVTFQRVLYNPDWSSASENKVLPPHHVGWYVSHLSVTLAVSLVLLYGALALFGRLEDNFAQEI